MRLPAVVFPAIAAMVLVHLWSPAPPPGCAEGQVAHFEAGFADLRQLLGASMGDPIGCEVLDPDTLMVYQQTSAGWAYYGGPGLDVPIFTNGFEHWALPSDTVLAWTEDEIDPPASARPVSAEELSTFDESMRSGADPRRFIGQGDRYNCGDFRHQADAQAVLRADPHDPNRLDRSRTGVACSNDPPPLDLRPVQPEPCTPPPVPGARSDANLLPSADCPRS